MPQQIVTLEKGALEASIAEINDTSTQNFGTQAVEWWDERFNWENNPCHVLSDDDGNHMAYLLYTLDASGDNLSIHYLFVPKNFRACGHARTMMEFALGKGVEAGAHRFNLSSVHSALAFYSRLGMVYWGINGAGQYYCDLPLPESGLAGVNKMVKSSSAEELAGSGWKKIFQKVQFGGERLSEEEWRHHQERKKDLGWRYQYKGLEVIAEAEEARKEARQDDFGKPWGA